MRSSVLPSFRPELCGSTSSVVYRQSPHDTVLYRNHNGLYLPVLLKAYRGLNEQHRGAARDVDGDPRVPQPGFEPAEMSPRSLRAASAGGTLL